jgi:type I pantothenate kinase
MYLLGIAGGVAVGKSTFARSLQEKLGKDPYFRKVQVISSDGFLFSNTVLAEKKIMHRKGFPDSYNVDSLVDFLNNLKKGKPAFAPLYNHACYDVLSNETLMIEENTNVVIVEGVNVLQKEYRDFFDCKFFLDADENLLIQRFLKRFLQLKKEAKYHPEVYFHRYSHLSDEDATNFALNVWKTINSVNLHEYILPCRQYADYVIYE